MKVIIAGSRTFNNYDLLEKVLQEENLIIEEIVCGGARGADALGAEWAKKNGVPVKYFNAKWEKYGRAAGIIRRYYPQSSNGRLCRLFNCLLGWKKFRY